MARPKDAPPAARRSITRNRRATHEFLVLDELECGIVLKGTEVKTLRQGQCSLQEAYCIIKRDELWIVRMHIPEYTHGNLHNHEPTRDRKLLAKKREILKWAKAVREKGTTLVPLEVLWEGSLIKVRIGLARGKKLHDKRESEKERDWQRQRSRLLRDRG